MRGFSIATILLALLFALLAGTAQASVITYSGVLDFNYATNGTLNVQQFDPALGNLTAVTIYIAHSGGAFFNVDNDDSYSVEAYAQMQRAWTVTGSGLNVSDTHTTTTPSVVLSPDNGDGTAVADYSSPDGYQWPSVSFNDSAIAYTIGSGDFGSYMGLGTLPITADVTTFSNAINFIGVPPNQVTTSMGNIPPGLRLNVSVEYTYDYVPEPSTLALLGLGLFGVGMVRRRKTVAA